LAYCNITTDLKIRGRYVNSNITPTIFSDDKLNEIVAFVCDIIHAKLYKAGITTLPIVASTHPGAYRRLKHLNALGANAEIEKALRDRAYASDSTVEDVGAILESQFYALLEIYESMPASLFADDVDSSPIGDVPLPPRRASGFYSYTSNNTDRNFSVDDEF